MQTVWDTKVRFVFVAYCGIDETLTETSNKCACVGTHTHTCTPARARTHTHTHAHVLTLNKKHTKSITNKQTNEQTNKQTKSTQAHMVSAFSLSNMLKSIYLHRPGDTIAKLCARVITGLTSWHLRHARDDVKQNKISGNTLNFSCTGR